MSIACLVAEVSGSRSRLTSDPSPLDMEATGSCSGSIPAQAEVNLTSNEDREESPPSPESKLSIYCRCQGVEPLEDQCEDGRWAPSP